MEEMLKNLLIKTYSFLQISHWCMDHKKLYKITYLLVAMLQNFNTFFFKWAIPDLFFLYIRLFIQSVNSK